MTPTRRSILLGLLGTLCAPAIARAGVQFDGGLAFGSSWRVTLATGAPRSDIRTRIEAVIDEVDRQMSPYRQTSHLSRFNASPTSAWQPMPEALCTVTQSALRIAALTGGAFDPTVGPIVSRLGFGPIEGRAGHFSGIAARPDALRKTARHLTLDLCGIAKGYALDRSADALRQAGVHDALIEIGGEVRALGTHPDGRDWNIAIADPRVQDGSVLAIVAPGPRALATSGHAINGVSGPVTTSHIIDAKRGRAASTALLSVSVLAPTATEADALATALCAVGPVEAVDLARRLDIAALMYRQTENGLVRHVTGDFARHLRS